MYSGEQFVWIDESGCDKRDSFRRFGYGFRGERPVCRRASSNESVLVLKDSEESAGGKSNINIT